MRALQDARTPSEWLLARCEIAAALGLLQDHLEARLEQARETEIPPRNAWLIASALWDVRELRAQMEVLHE